MIVLATPGMMNGGTSVEVFKHFCDDPKNCCIIPGYCVPGTLGN
jgi:integrator complex subunit 11